MWKDSWLLYLMGMVASNAVIHNSNFLAEWAHVSLHSFLDEELAKFGTRTPTEDQVKEAILNSFDKVENEFKRVALEAYKLHYSTIC